MGKKQSTPLSSPSEFHEPWRKMQWGKQKELEEKLRNFHITNPAVSHVRILIIGAVGAGKSSIINSINNAFQHRITSIALVASASEQSFTEVHKTYYIKGADGSPMPFVFTDIMGLEPATGSGANPQNIIDAIHGLVKDGYNFKLGSRLFGSRLENDNSQYYRTNPDLQHKVFCVVNVVAADTLSLMDQRVIEKLKVIRYAASDLDLPQVILLTKVEAACPLVKKDLKNIYKSIKIKEKMQTCSNLSGIPMNHIFPVKNYHEEVDNDDDVDLLILKALDQIVHIANDALNMKCFSNNDE